MSTECRSAFERRVSAFASSARRSTNGVPIRRLNDGSSVGGRVLKRAAFRRRLLKPFRFFAIERAFCVERPPGLGAKMATARVLGVAAEMKVGVNFNCRSIKRRRFARILTAARQKSPNERKPSDRKKSAATQFRAQNTGDVDFFRKKSRKFSTRTRFRV